MNDPVKKEINRELIETIKKIPVGYSRFIIESFFWIGIVSAILLRLTYILEHYNPIWSKTAWYVGVLGYTLFFMHRYRVSARRKNTIRHLDLLKKIKNQEKLDEVDYNALEYVLWSISVSKEKLNYLIILVFSFIAVALALILEFI
ncbi:MAG: hypothetical protein A2Y40_08035 [Candidatus Margulisbacteria bacterium GWF2_35_9]|nr:MAG: hypothetical protein A2Y40_08035 [Candidatus Margulisbacteria bacterium GWF2_35_9]